MQSFIFNIIIIDGMLLFLIAPQIKEYFTLNAIIYFQFYNYRWYVIISYCSTNQRIFHIECNHFIFNLIIIVCMLLFLIASQIKEYFTLNEIIYFQSYNYRGYVIISYCFTNQRIFHIEFNHLFSIL